MKKFEELSPFEQSIRQNYEGYQAISKNTGIKMRELLPMILIRELVLANRERRAIHEHVDKHLPIDTPPKTKGK